MLLSILGLGSELARSLRVLRPGLMKKIVLVGQGLRVHETRDCVHVCESVEGRGVQVGEGGGEGRGGEGSLRAREGAKEDRS